MEHQDDFETETKDEPRDGKACKEECKGEIKAEMKDELGDASSCKEECKDEIKSEIRADRRFTVVESMNPL